MLTKGALSEPENLKVEGEKNEEKGGSMVGNSRTVFFFPINPRKEKRRKGGGRGTLLARSVG